MSEFKHLTDEERRMLACAALLPEPGEEAVTQWADALNAAREEVAELRGELESWEAKCVECPEIAHAREEVERLEGEYSTENPPDLNDALCVHCGSPLVKYPGTGDVQYCSNDCNGGWNSRGSVE